MKDILKLRDSDLRKDTRTVGPQDDDDESEW